MTVSPKMYLSSLILLVCLSLGVRGDASPSADLVPNVTCAIQFAPVKINITNVAGIDFYQKTNASYVRLATDTTCNYQFPGTSDVYLRNNGTPGVNSYVYVFSPSEAGDAYFCYSNYSIDTDTRYWWNSVFSNGDQFVYINPAPTWRMESPSHAIAGQNFAFSVGYYGDGVRYYNDTGSGSPICPISGQTYSIKLAYDPTCGLDFTNVTNADSSASYWNQTATTMGSGCPSAMNFTAMSDTPIRLYLCMTFCNNISFAVVRPGPIVINPAPLWMGPDLVASQPATFQFARVYPRGNEPAWSVKACSSADCTGTCTSTADWSPGFSATITPSATWRWGTYFVCFKTPDPVASLNPANTWMMIYPKVRNSAVVQCQTQRTDMTCWCTTDDDTGTVTADCRPYYFEPWVDQTYPFTKEDVLLVQSNWDQNSFDGWTEFYTPYMPPQPPSSTAAL